MSHPLQLSVHPGAWRAFVTRKVDKAFQPFAEKVLRRDRYTCQFCGFQARDYQEVVNIDQNYYNNKLSNLTTACVFCAQCFFLDSVGIGDYGGGLLIYLPEIEQAALNSLCHVLFCAISNDTGYKPTAQSTYRTLKFRSQPVEEQFGEGTSAPHVLGRLILESCLEGEKQAKILQDIRLLPSRGRFRAQVDHWAAAAVSELAAE